MPVPASGRIGPEAVGVDPVGAADGPEIEQLRRLLLGLPGDEFAELVRTLRDRGARTAAIAEVLTEAIARRNGSDDSLGATLGPTIENALHRSIDRNPEPIANAIYPVIGPSIRKAITAAISDLVQGLNQAVEMQFSPRALRWRWSAWRAGLSYSEYLFAQNITYRLDHAFLFHRETSLLLTHVAADGAWEADSDMVSSMLSAMTTALTDFMHDSFQSDSEAARRSWTVDEHSIHVQGGEFAVIALVSRGTPPPSKLAAMSDCLDVVHVQYRESLRDFDGETDVYAAVRPRLEDLLRQGPRDDAGEGTVAKASRWPAIAVAGLVLLGLLAWGARGLQLDGAARDVVAALDAAPGIFVTASERRGSRLLLEGLRDPGAASIEIVTAPVAGPLRLESNFSPFLSMDAGLVADRLLRALAVPGSASARVEGDVLVLSGEADRDLLERAGTLVANTPGMMRVDAAALTLTESREARLEGLRAALERQRFYFEVGDATLGEAHRARLRAIVGELGELFALGDALDRSLRVVVIGQSDIVGALQFNQTISNARSDAVRSLLVELGIPAARLGSAARIISEEDADARQVRFEVVDAGPARDGSEAGSGE